MKNKYWIIAVFLLIILGLTIYWIFNSINHNNTQIADYSANRTEASIDANENSQSEEDTYNQNYAENASSKQETFEGAATKNISKPEAPPVETEISSFTTKIYSKDSGRQNNVQITCNTLNDTVVEDGSTFSFCNTVGQATTAKGYQEAEIFDAKRK